MSGPGAARAAAEDAAEPFLGVTRSARGRAWRARPVDEALARSLAQALDTPEALGRVLAGRGVTVDRGETFLNPSLKASFPDPARFADMDKAAAVLSDAIESGRPTAVFADYDVDGATSAAQLIRYFRARGRDLDLYVPDRVEEGYGPSAPAFQALKDRGIELVVTVDCGAMAHDALEAAADMGLEIVVLDHHQMTAAPPRAAAVVNPNRPDCPSGCGYLAAAGLVFVTLAALNREGRRRGAFETAPEPDLIGLLDLAALGTICDVAPLIEANRAFAAQGLKVLNKQRRAGVAALAEVAGANRDLDSYAAGFILGPRINAGGRVGRADLGARLLSTDATGEAGEIAAELDAFNSQRRAVEQAVLDEALARLAADPKAEGRDAVVVAGDGWHPGVIGVVAGRLKERLQRPVVVIGFPDGDLAAPGKGSGRSVSGVDLGQAIANLRDDGALIAGGGHPMAAGVTIARDQVARFADGLDAAVKAGGGVPAPSLTVDALLAASGATREFAEIVARAGPFGPGNSEPVFAMSDLRVRGSSLVGGRHLRVSLEDPGGTSVSAIAFRAEERGLSELLSRRDAQVHVALRIKPGRGRFVDVEIEDVAEADA